MNLSEPIIVNLNPLKKRDGSFKNLPPVKLNELKITILDDVKAKECSVRIVPFPKPLVLWKGEDYEAVGDYTQAQVEAKILEKLGNNPAEVLKTLMPTYEIVVK